MNNLECLFGSAVIPDKFTSKNWCAICVQNSIDANCHLFIWIMNVQHRIIMMSLRSPKYWSGNECCVLPHFHVLLCPQSMGVSCIELSESAIPPKYRRQRTAIPSRVVWLRKHSGNHNQSHMSVILWARSPENVTGMRLNPPNELRPLNSCFGTVFFSTLSAKSLL